jgi:hypothetical protein
MALFRLRKQCRIITVTSTQPLLGGVAEISDEFGVPRTTVSMWDARRGTNGFPEPVERLRMGPIYRMDQVREWYLSRASK